MATKKSSTVSPAPRMTASDKKWQAQSESAHNPGSCTNSGRQRANDRCAKGSAKPDGGTEFRCQKEIKFLRQSQVLEHTIALPARQLQT